MFLLISAAVWELTFRSSTSAPPQPLFNIVLRAAMEKLQLKLINRDYFDPKAAVPFSQHKLELWPGYVTSIRQHEQKMQTSS